MMYHDAVARNDVCLSELLVLEEVITRVVNQASVIWLLVIKPMIDYDA